MGNNIGLLQVITVLDEEGINLSREADMRLLDVLSLNHDALVFSHPGGETTIINLTEEMKTADEYLEEFAQTCWGENWPDDDDEYEAFIVNPSTQVIESITGPYIFRDF